MSSPFKRYIQVRVKNSAFNATWSSDGTQNTVRIRVDDEMKPMFVPSHATVSLWNLSDSSRKLLQANARYKVTDFVEAMETSESLDIEVDAGYTRDLHSSNPTKDNLDNVGTIFKGFVRSVQSVRQNADIVTQLKCIHAPYGADFGSTMGQFYVGGNAPPDDAIRSVFGHMTKSIDWQELDKEGMSKYYVSGNARRLAEELHYKGVHILATGTGYTMTSVSRVIGTPFPISYNSNLISITPHTESELSFETGAKIECMFSPAIFCGGVVKVDALLQPDMSRYYKVTYKNDKLDTGGNDFNSTIMCLYQMFGGLK